MKSPFQKLKSMCNFDENKITNSIFFTDTGLQLGATWQYNTFHITAFSAKSMHFSPYYRGRTYFVSVFINEWNSGIHTRVFPDTIHSYLHIYAYINLLHTNTHTVYCSRDWWKFVSFSKVTLLGQLHTHMDGSIYTRTGYTITLAQIKYISYEAAETYYRSSNEESLRIVIFGEVLGFDSDSNNH
jgi:hypothetical protein